MIIVNVKDQTCEIQQNTANFQQVVKSDVLIHHSNHLPTVVNSAVGAEAKEFSNRLPFQVCPQTFSIPHFAKNVKQKPLLLNRLLKVSQKNLTIWDWFMSRGFFHFSHRFSYPAGNVSVMAVPSPGSLSTWMAAWWSAAPCLTMDSPRPVPPTALEWLLSTR